jgi:hypothetical protein
MIYADSIDVDENDELARILRAVHGRLIVHSGRNIIPHYLNHLSRLLS